MSTHIIKKPNTPLSDPTSRVEEFPSTTGSSFNCNAKRLSIHITMGEHAYLQRKSSHMRDTLSVESTLSENAHSTTTPTTVAYTAQDHPGIYTSVSWHVLCPCWKTLRENQTLTNRRRWPTMIRTLCPMTLHRCPPRCPERVPLLCQREPPQVWLTPSPATGAPLNDPLPQGRRDLALRIG